jgi:hypothetical protein
MSRAGERTIIIEPLLTELGEMVADEARLDGVLRNLAGTLTEVGGRIEVMADRVKIGEIPGAHNGKPTLLAETVGYVVRYSPSAPVNESSITRNAMAVARQDDEPEPEPEVGVEAALAGGADHEED